MQLYIALLRLTTICILYNIRRLYSQPNTMKGRLKESHIVQQSKWSRKRGYEPYINPRGISRQSLCVTTSNTTPPYSSGSLYCRIHLNTMGLTFVSLAVASILCLIVARVSTYHNTARCHCNAAQYNVILYTLLRKSINHRLNTSKTTHMSRTMGGGVLCGDIGSVDCVVMAPHRTSGSGRNRADAGKTMLAASGWYPMFLE